MRITDMVPAYHSLEKDLPGREQTWLQGLRKSALQDIETIGFPTLKTEDWKYTRVNSLLQAKFEPVISEQAKIQADVVKPYFVTTEYKLVFVDGFFAPHLSGKLNSNITIFSNALFEKNAWLKAYLGKAVTTKTPGFSALNTALMQEGAVIHINAKQKLEQPIQLLFLQTSQATIASHIRNVIVLEEQSEASIVETYVSLSNEAVYFTNAVTEIFLQPSSQLHYYKQQQESQQAFHVHTAVVEQAHDSQLVTINIDLGAKLARNWLQSNLTATGAGCEMHGLYIVDGERHIDNHTRVEHQQPHTSSRENYRGLLFDKGHAVFNGQVLIEKHAQKSDAEQRNKNLVLSATAELDTKPQLEIYADDVKCAHGAAIGELDQNAIFYLQTRGIDKHEAEALLISGFANEIVEKIRLGQLQEHLQKKIKSSFFKEGNYR